MEQNYKIHDIVRFKVVGEMGRRMAIEYANFETNETTEVDFTVYLGAFTPSNDGCQVLDDKYHIKYNYIYCEDTYKMGRWKLEISGLESQNMVIRLWTNMIGRIFADMFICAFVIDSVIRLTMNLKGYSPIHAAAVCSNGSALLFPAQGGAGKTTTATYFTGEGYDFLGDDFVILGNQHVFSWLTPLNYFTYNFSPVIKKNTGILDRVLLVFKNIVYRVSFGHIKIFSKVNPKEVFLTCEQSGIKAVFFLAPSGSFNITPMDKSELIKRLLINCELETFPFYRYMLAYSYAFPQSKIAKHWHDCESNLTKNLPSDVTIYRVDVPRKYSEETFRNIFKIVQDVK